MEGLSTSGKDDALEAAIRRHVIRITGADHNKHKPLSLDDQRFNSRIQIRMAGADMQGHLLSREQAERDVHVVQCLYDSQVVVSKTLAQQLRKYQGALKAVGGDPSRLSENDFSFLKGAHVPGPPWDTLKEVCLDTGYCLLAEYADDDNEPIPLAYNYGFPVAPYDDPRFPTLNVKDEPSFTGHEGSIFISWKIGVLPTYNRSVRRKMHQLGIKIPKDLHSMQFQRKGIANAFRPVTAAMAKSLDCSYITLNSASLRRPGALMDSTLLNNRAIRRTNEHTFQRSFARREVTKIFDKNRHIADAIWEVFMQEPDKLLAAEMDPATSVLLGKGGWDIDKLVQMGHIAVGVLEERERIKSVVSAQEILYPSKQGNSSPS